MRNLAPRMSGRLPILYAPAGGHPVSGRWENQKEENAKVWCSALAIPEANHNDIESWGRGPAWAKSQVVILRDPRGESPALRWRLDVSTRMLRSASRGRLITVRAEGRGALARMWSLVALGDAVSVALADRLRVDSMPIPMIDRLKSQLGRGVRAIAPSVRKDAKEEERFWKLLSEHSLRRAWEGESDRWYRDLERTGRTPKRRAGLKAGPHEKTSSRRW